MRIGVKVACRLPVMRLWKCREYVPAGLASAFLSRVLTAGNFHDGGVLCFHHEK